MKSAKNDSGQRQLRVGEAIRHSLSDILRRGHFRDPDLQRANVSITEVRISPDLKNATAYVMPLAADPETTKICIKALNRAAPFIRGALAKTVELRVVPAVKFEADTSLDYAKHIDVLLKQHVQPDE
jgi:ribosome-binding factor A